MRPVGILSIILVLTFSFMPSAGAGEDAFMENTPETSMGGDEYLGPDGSLSMEEDMGGGQLVSEDGGITETEDAGGGEEISLEGDPVIMSDQVD